MNRTTSNWQHFESMLDTLLALPVDAREAWLQSHCADPALRTRLRAILAADAEHGSSLEHLALTGNPWAAEELAADPASLPEVAGYRVLNLLGEGGMASVFLAERDVAGGVQKVALKRLRFSVHDPVERRRFEAEQRILARLEHPGIARFIDAGVAADGVPWYAMEYVEGQTLIAWCDARRSSIEQRLDLIIEVCRAVHYAHQHLVIHRDIKPSNILVDEEGSARLLDFGVAKLLDPDTDRTETTRTEHRRLTPAYAAPEQFDGTVSTASDIYALGVLLMEMVSGSRPRIVAANTTEDRFGELVITDEQAADRQTSTKSLSRVLSGAPGAIARKAMRKEPELRYGSAQAMAEDIQAWRQGLPVEARRGDWLYRSGCFVRRHALGVAVAAGLIAVLLGATAFSLQQAKRADTQAEISRTVQSVMEDMLGPLYESLPPDEAPKLEALVANNVAKLVDDDAHKPAVQAELLAMFTRTYARINKTEQALELAQRSYEFNRAAFGSFDPRSLHALAMYGEIKHKAGDAKGALIDLHAAISAMREQGITGRKYLQALESLAFVVKDLGDEAQGIALLREASNNRVRQFGPDSVEAASGYSNLAEMHIESRQWAEAIPYLQRAYRAYLQRGEQRLAAVNLGKLGRATFWTGHDLESGAIYRQTLDMFERLKGSEHPIPQSVLFRACAIRILLDEIESAKALGLRAIEIAEHIGGAGSEMHSLSWIHYASALVLEGRLQEARDIMWRERFIQLSKGAETELIRSIDLSLSYQQVVDGEWQAMRDGLLPLFADMSITQEPITPMIMARLALACHFAPSNSCPSDLEARTDRVFTLPYFANSNYLHIDPLLTLAELALARNDPQASMQRLRKVDALVSLPDSSVRGNHYLLIVAAMLRGETEAALGHTEAAQHYLRIAASGFVERGFKDDHPYRRRVATAFHYLKSANGETVFKPN